MDKQKAAVKMLKEAEQLLEEIKVMAHGNEADELPYVLEDKGAVVTHVARFQILKEELSDLEGEMDDDIDDDELGEHYDQIVKIHKIVSEQCSIMRTLLGL